MYFCFTGACSGTVVSLVSGHYYRKVIGSDCSEYSALSSDIHRVKILYESTEYIVDCDLTAEPYKMLIIPTAADVTNIQTSVKAI